MDGRSRRGDRPDFAFETIRNTGRGAAWRRAVLWPLGALVLLSVGTSCTLTVDPDRPQCASDSDCEDRGEAFLGSVCEDGLCRLASVERPCDGGDCAPSDPVDGARDACVGARCGSQNDARVTPPPNLRDARVSPAPDAGPGEREASVEPRECTVDEDCAARGMPGAQCVDTVCWQPPSMSQCEQDADCAALGPEYVDGLCLDAMCRPNPRWRCEPPMPPEGSELITLRTLLRDSLSLAALRDVRARVCPKLDLDCVAPITEGTTGRDGILQVDVPPDFAGYLRVEDTRYAPALYFLPPALPSDGELQPFPLLGVGVIDALALAIGSTLDSERGHLMLIAEDCFGAALAGVMFESPQADESTIQFYVRDLLPSPEATETGEIGNGGYINFPAGTAVFDVNATMLGLKLTTFSVGVRPGFITVVYTRPDLR